MDMFETFVVPMALAGAFVVGYVVKNFLPNDQVNKFIPAICAVVGAILTCWMNMSITAELVVQGLVSGAAATTLYEQYKNMQLYGLEKKIEGMATDPMEIEEAEKDGE